jgi:CYTH domain-containing protein
MVEEALWEPDAMRWDWVIVPEVARDLLSAQGAIDVEASGNGSKRRVHGHVSAKVPLFGARVEGVIVAGLERAYDEEGRRLLAWLGRKGGTEPV